MNYQDKKTSLLVEDDSLAASEIRYRRLFDTARDGILILDAQTGKIVDVNPSLVEMLGYSKGQFMEKAIWEMRAFKDVVANSENFLELQQKQHVRYEDVPLETARGVRVDVEFMSTTYLVENQKLIQCTIRTITDMKISEELIRTLLAEKGLILKEVHHRIASNMSIIASLLALQAQVLTIPAAVTALKDAESRVQGMLLLHNKLRQSSVFASIPVREYLPSLIGKILANFPNGDSIKVWKIIEDFALDAEKLQPLGIIIDELLTNIMEHAFTGSVPGVITVSAYLRGATVHLSIEDNGIGMPKGLDFANSPGCGLKLVGMLARQLGGRIRIEVAQGTSVILEFAA